MITDPTGTLKPSPNVRPSPLLLIFNPEKKKKSHI